MAEEIEKVVAGLNFGDRIDVGWYDASEVGKGGLPGKCVDTFVYTTGFYLGTKGKRRKHLVLAKEIMDGGRNYHYNVILFDMIDKVILIRPDALDPRVKKVLRKFVRVSINSLRKKDGWAFGNDIAKRLKRARVQTPATKKAKKQTKDERIQSLEIRVAVLEERVKYQAFLEKVIWVLLVTSLGKLVLEALKVIG